METAAALAERALEFNRGAESLVRGAITQVARSVTGGRVEPEEHHVDGLMWLGTAFVFLLTFGHLLAGVPIKRLGTNTGGGVRTRTLGYDNSRGEFPHHAAFLIVLALGLAAFYFLKPWPVLFFLAAARVVWRNLFSRMTSKPPPPRQGEQVLNETPQFPPGRRKFDELHKYVFGFGVIAPTQCSSGSVPAPAAVRRTRVSSCTLHATQLWCAPFSPLCSFVNVHTCPRND